MLKFVSVFLLIVGCVVLTSCNRENETLASTTSSTNAVLIVDFDTKWGAADFVMQQVYNDSYGNRVRLDNFKAYISMLTLIKEDGTEVLLRDFHLKNFSDTKTLSFNIASGVYTGIKFGLGVPVGYNRNVDPAQYPNSHPLSVAGAQDMFWGWNSGYIFSKFEGKADTTGVDGTSLLRNFAFHAGDSASYIEFISLTENFDFKQDTTSLVTINFHIDEILGSGPEGINIQTENISSGASPLGLKYVGRLANAITID